jgi:hypothetical protein
MAAMAAAAAVVAIMAAVVATVVVAARGEGGSGEGGEFGGGKGGGKEDGKEGGNEGGGLKPPKCAKRVAISILSLCSQPRPMPVVVSAPVMCFPLSIRLASRLLANAMMKPR